MKLLQLTCVSLAVFITPAISNEIETIPTSDATTIVVPIENVGINAESISTLVDADVSSLESSDEVEHSEGPASNVAVAEKSTEPTVEEAKEAESADSSIQETLGDESEGKAEDRDLLDAEADSEENTKVESSKHFNKKIEEQSDIIASINESMYKSFSSPENIALYHLGDKVTPNMFNVSCFCISHDLYTAVGFSKLSIEEIFDIVKFRNPNIDTSVFFDICNQIRQDEEIELELTMADVDDVEGLEEFKSLMRAFGTNDKSDELFSETIEINGVELNFVDYSQVKTAEKLLQVIENNNAAVAE